VSSEIQSRFIEQAPTLESYWRSVILFGANVASYKFALGKSLLELANSPDTFISLEQLAEPFSLNLIAHIKGGRKQTTSRSSRFLDACKKSIEGEINQDELLSTTSRLGFVNVIDAFHVVNGKEISTRFFTDERKSAGRSVKGIRLTDELFQLKEAFQSVNLPYEVESRWQLVEAAWDLNVARNLITISYDDNKGLFFTKDRSLQRVDVTSARSAINGYQKGKCFYCFRDIAVDDHIGAPAEVDHFFPHALTQYRPTANLNGVWNLVLACQSCNRGVAGKSARVPSFRLLESLNRRNDYLISSNHPLRETLLGQTGALPQTRRSFLQNMDSWAIERLIHRWEPKDELEVVF
jgi:hypothetical protein